MSRIPVYESEFTESREPITYVNYNRNLDYWDGSNWSNGGIGLHLGITRIKSGDYVLIHTSQWGGAKDYAYVVSDKQALDAILTSDNEKLLEGIKFRPLRNLMNSQTEIEEIEAQKTITKTGNGHSIPITKDEMLLLGVEVGDTVNVLISKCE